MLHAKSTKNQFYFLVLEAIKERKVGNLLGHFHDTSAIENFSIEKMLSRVFSNSFSFTDDFTRRHEFRLCDTIEAGFECQRLTAPKSRNDFRKEWSVTLLDEARDA